MSENKRHIELAVVKVDGDQVTFRIAEQTHREKEFCKDGWEFTAKNGFLIRSRRNPEILENIVYVRGYIAKKDNECVTTNIANFAKIMEAVTEYNETDCPGYEKPWPQEGDKYLWVGSTGFIHESYFDDAPLDNGRRGFGNMFRTREEAEAALERVKKAMKCE